MVGFLSFH